MNERDLSAALAIITGFLEPTAEAPAADLRAARLAVASALLRGQVEDTHVASPRSDNPEPLSNPALVAELQTIRAEAALEIEKTSGNSLPARVFRREFPLLTSANPASIPAWAAGLRPDQSLGPFRSLGGWPVWFDIYRPTAHQVQIVQEAGGPILLKLPMRGFLHAATGYRVVPGSAWISSELLSVPAPVGSWTGLQTIGGTLQLSSMPTIVAGAIQIAFGVTMTLSLDLHPTAPDPGTGAGPGADSANCSANVPSQATFVLNTSSPAVVTPGDASVTMYGVTAALFPTGQTPFYDPTMGRVLVPYTTPVTSFTVVRSLSGLFTPFGTAPIAGAAWALPVAVGPGALGAASGSGALVLLTQPGLQAKWRGLAGGAVALGPAFIAFEQGLLWVTAGQARNRRATQTIELWIENAGTRRSSIDLEYAQPFPLQFFSESGLEALTLQGTAVGHFDRPRRADGTRLGPLFPRGVLELFENADGRFALFIGIFPRVFVSAGPPPEQPFAFALTNALLVVRGIPASSSTDIVALTLFGAFDRAVPLAMPAGTLVLRFVLYVLLPALPDPYAANFDVPVSELNDPLAELDAKVRWSAPEAPELTFVFLPVDAGGAISPQLASDAALGVRPAKLRTAADIRLAARPLVKPANSSVTDPGQIFEEDARRTQELRSLFNESVDGTNETLFLLDVSSNADQLGVCLGFGEQGQDAFPLQVQDLDLSTGANNVRLFTPPLMQWEPVYTIQNPDVGIFPSPLLSGDDGGPALLGVNTVELVPIAPRPVLDQIVTLYNLAGGNQAAGALFTLPFGMKAVASLLSPFDRNSPGVLLDLNQPGFESLPQPLEGGLQVRLEASSAGIDPGAESPHIAGATIQLRNGVDEFGNALFESVLGPSVDTIFNAEFAPDGKASRVPVTRIDFSGYGASMFSRWVNPGAQLAQTSQVRFDVMLGRTAYEVVQVRSIMYPWGIRVVRTVTIQRTGGGGVFRRDSGWIAASDGIYDFSFPGNASAIATHPGIVKGVFDVRNIRDTTQVYSRDYVVVVGPVVGVSTVRLAAVRFDANVRIAGVVRGGVNGDVPSGDQIGFVQLEPSGSPLTPAQYADLLADQGPLGGPVDCLIDVGGSGQQMRLTRVDVATAVTPGGQFEFAAAGRGSPMLPKDGQWSVVRKPANNNLEAQALDRNFGVPLVRQGVAGLADASNANPYLFADPGDVLTPDRAQTDYGWFWSTGTQRILFPRPKIAKGALSLTSNLAPLLADSFAMGNATGIFPPANACLNVPSASYALQIQGNAGLRLVLPLPRFSAVLVGGGTTRDLGGSASTRFYVDYSQTMITLALDSTASPSWTYQQEAIAFISESNGAIVKTSHGKIAASSVSASQFTLQSEEFGQIFAPVKPLMPLFGSVTLGGNIPGDGATRPLDSTPAPDPKVDVKAGVKIELSIPEGLDLFIGVTANGGSIEIETDFHSFYSLDIVVPLLLLRLFPVAAKFTYDAETVNAATPLPGTSHALPVGTKESLLLALGAYGDGHAVLAPLQFNYKLFVGIAFATESKPGEKSLGIGIVFDFQGSVQYPVDVALVEAGIKVQGQGLFEIRTGDLRFIVLKGKLAFELTVALFIDIEFDLPDFKFAEWQV